MTAIVQGGYGTDPGSVLRVGEVPIPAAGDGEVLVRVHAAGLDRGTWHIMSGLPYAIRAAGFGLRRPKWTNPGSDLAGVVEAVGPGVTGFSAGDEVFGRGRGAFAPWAVARADRIAVKPPSLGFAEAAALPASGGTALQAVRDRARIGPGENVLIIGASGGVGSYAVQLAKADGARVTGVCGASKADLVNGLGADRVLDYARQEITDGGTRYDVILDIAGGRPVSLLRGALAPDGRLVLVGGDSGNWFGWLGRPVHARLLSPFVGQTLGSFIASERASYLETLAGLVEDGALSPAIERTYPLVQTAAAIEHLAAGRARGKVVVVL